MIKQKWFWVGVIVPSLMAILAFAGGTNAVVKADKAVTRTELMAAIQAITQRVDKVEADNAKTRDMQFQTMMVLLEKLGAAK